jgi:transcriptional regulator with XRE-family HTH domain
MISRDVIYRAFGEIVAKRRRDAGLKQGAFAKRIGLSRTSVTNIERGRQAVNLHTVYLMADAVGRDVSDLLPASPTPLIQSEFNRAKSSNRRSQRGSRIDKLSSREFSWLTNISAPIPRKSK